MRFSDESRSESPILAANRSRYLADIDKFVADHEVLLKRRKRDASTIRTLQAELKKSQESNKKLTAEVKHLAADNGVLRSTLSALRRSSRVRVGTAVTAPVRALAKLRPKPAEQSRGVRMPGQVSPQGPVNRSPVMTAANRLKELRGLAEALPSKANVYNLLAHLYFVHGQISEPASLIEDHRKVLVDFTAKERQLVDAILGLDRLTKQPVVLSPVQSNPGYQPERGRVLYCAHSVAPYNSNGYSTRTAGLIHGIAQAGADVVVAARPGYPWDVKTDRAPASKHSYSENIDGLPHSFSHGPSWTQSPLDHYLQQAADSYVQIAIRNRPDRIIAASNYVTALPALMAARRLGIPFTFEVRGLWEVTEASTKQGWENSERYLFAKNMETLVATEADAVFAITQQVQDELVRRGVAEHKTRLLPNAVNTNEFSDMPAHAGTAARLGLSEGVPVIGYAGSLVAYEGLDTLLDACKVLVSKDIDVRMVIVGDGPVLPQLKERAGKLNISDSVIFTGRVAATEIPAYISLFDIMPCPRMPLPITEMVSPLKPLEAMAAAKAVVLSRLAPMIDLAGDDGDRARLFTAGDTADLAEVLEDLIRDPAQRRAMGRRARLWTVEHRTWRKVGKEALTAHADLQLRLAEGERSLSQLTIGIIADEFTVSGLEPETSLVALSPKDWAKQMVATPIDALFVESAWEGNGGLWRGKVGYYDEESFSDLSSLLAYCRQHSIPTIFWNKEDPVHFNRFQETARHFEFIFTSDDGSIQGYLDSAGPHFKSAASMPFYAQPALHNPLPGSRSYSHTVSYAGSYYGDRYKKRSDQLHALLAAALPSGLTIYDRQHLNPESPYRFPPDLAPYVSGGLAYPDMVQAYKSHPVHVNVNSVEESGTMFSRRVFEVAACGGAVISGPGRGLEQVFGGVIPVVADQVAAEALIAYWMQNESARNIDAWLAMRSVFRGHTAAHRLAYVLRTAGLRVSAPVLAKYSVIVPEFTPEVAKRLGSQSVLPTLVFVESGNVPDQAGAPFPILGYDSQMSSHLEERGIVLWGRTEGAPLDRTYYEDLLTSRKYLLWDKARIDPDGIDRTDGLAHIEMADHLEPGLQTLNASSDAETLILKRQVLRQQDSKPSTPARQLRKILVAGHDLKFARGIIDSLTADGHKVEIDLWRGHAQHDAEKSRALLANADIIFCEWTLGNAVWFANHKRPSQRLVCRLHSQELGTAYLKELKTSNVDRFIFVGQRVANIAARDFGVPSNRSVVLPNYVDVARLQEPKVEEARWNLGLVGVVPQLKRLDLALDVLRELRRKDERFSLFIKGKRAQDYPWMADRPDEMDYYQTQDRRIQDDPLLRGSVHFDPHGDDMPKWYAKIGTVLSVSDLESFHLTLADGAASGALPATLAWPGADQIYPVSWISPDISTLVERIFLLTASHKVWSETTKGAQSFVREKFVDSRVLADLKHAIVGT